MKELREKFEKAGQGHVFRFFEELSDNEKEVFKKEIEEVDPFFINNLYKTTAQKKENLEILPPSEKDIFFPEKEDKDTIYQLGIRAIKNSEVGIVLVAGGQGTRLGFEGPKGKFPITPVKKKTLFQLQAEKILRLSQKYNVVLPWYIMTSRTNHKETVEYFEENGYFNLGKENVFFFQQDMLCAVDFNGKIIMQNKYAPFKSPNGHGGVIKALYEKGAIEDMKKRGIKYIFYYQVDNPLIKMADPYFIGAHILKDAEFSAKVLPKRSPEEKVGVYGYINGKMAVIEYSDLPKEKMYEKDEKGNLKYNAGNIAIHVFNVDFIERLNKGGFVLPYHVAKKKIPYITEDGKTVKPTEPNGIKFETFVFDAVGYANKFLLYQGTREEDFSPVKNKEGEDSPQTATQDLCNLWGRWLEKVGCRIPKNSKGDVSIKIEISPLKGVDEEDFIANFKDKDIIIKDGLYIG